MLGVGACLSQRVLFLSHTCGQGEYSPQYSHTHRQAQEGVLFFVASACILYCSYSPTAGYQSYHS